MNICIYTRLSASTAAFAVAFLAFGLWAAAPAGEPDLTTVFTSGTDGYHTYRIPAVVASKKGTLLAFCEGRKSSRSDTGKIDVLLKRSEDGGSTWQPQRVLWTDDGNVCGNPAPVVDQATGEIWLLLTWNRGEDDEHEIQEARSVDTRRVFVTSSRDDGLTWSKPREITKDVKQPHWRWYATGPVNGIQLTRAPHTGRLLIPANHSDHSETNKHPYRAHVIYSDDHGQSWRLGGIEAEMTNESTVIERTDGSLLHNMRSYHGKNRRAIATSADGGASWSATTLDAALVEPVCQASLLRYSWPDAGRPGIVLFSNPASTKRENLSVRASDDDAATWSNVRTVYAGPSAYSCLVVLPDQRVGCLFECGNKNPYEKIVLARFAVSWLTDPRK